MLTLKFLTSVFMFLVLNLGIIATTKEKLVVVVVVVFKRGEAIK